MRVKKCTDTQLSYNIYMFQHFKSIYNGEDAAKLAIGGGNERCDICRDGFGASRQAYTGHGSSGSAFQAQAHYGSEVCLTLLWINGQQTSKC